jgi:hypothetical protein
VTNAKSLVGEFGKRSEDIGFLKKLRLAVHTVRTHGSVAGRVTIPDELMDFSIDLTLPAGRWLWDRLSL